MSDPTLTNKRPQRTLYGIFNGDKDLLGYKADQLKLLLIDENDYLGKKGHYHDYGELYYVAWGQVIFDLWDRGGSGTKERVILEPGEILLIPAGVAHRAYAQKGTLLVGSSSGEFTFDPPADIAADFEPVGPLPYGLK